MINNLSWGRDILHKSFMHVHSLQTCLTLCNPKDYSPPGSSVHGDSSGKNSGMGCHFLHQGNLPDPGIEPTSPALQVDSLLLSKSWINTAAAAKSLQLCPPLCDPIDGSPPGSPVPGILQARTLEWVAISFSSAWKWKVKVKSLSRVQLFMTPWTAAHQAPPSMGLSRQECWSGVPLPSPLNPQKRRISLAFSWLYTSCIFSSEWPALDSVLFCLCLGKNVD